MEKALIKYDGIEFSLPLAVTTTTILPSIFLIALAVFFVGEYFGKKKR
jgi:hypothetical protein